MLSNFVYPDLWFIEIIADPLFETSTKQAFEQRKRKF